MLFFKLSEFIAFLRKPCSLNLSLPFYFHYQSSIWLLFIHQFIFWSGEKRDKEVLIKKILIIGLIFRAVLGLQKNYTENIKSSHVLLSPLPQFLLSLIPCIICGMFITSDKLIVAHYYLQKTMIYMRAHSWSFTCCGFCQMHNVMYPP